MRTVEVIQRFPDGTNVREFVSQIEVENGDVIGYMLSSDIAKALSLNDSEVQKTVCLIKSPTISETELVDVLTYQATVPLVA